jgi:diaminohydroxyphosphoribosylaminopyrimidine deaminase/5-amino-6-(5-phosphoribosylamino)uracil reductase
LTVLDRQRLGAALLLAESSFGLTEPNPRVGCIIGRADGSVLGRGATQAAGQAHAEVVALRDVPSLGHDVRGATAWVTLEPCSHHGRTPPCCDALIEAGIARVVVAVSDPYAAVNGRGIERLRAAGVQVDLASADLAAAARELNVGFFSRQERGRPWVRLKVAASLDGRTALPDGRSQWITGPQARADGHAWRRRASAVLTGIGTVLADRPRLDVRLVPTPCQPLRVVLDSSLRLPPDAPLLAAPGPVLVLTRQADGAGAERLRARGAEVLRLPGSGPRLALPEVLSALGQRAVNEVHIEAGAVLNGAWLDAGLVDELLVYLAPVLLGEGHPMARLAALGELAAARRWTPVETQRLGEDLRWRLRAQTPPFPGVGTAYSQAPDASIAATSLPK